MAQFQREFWSIEGSNFFLELVQQMNKEAKVVLMPEKLALKCFLQIYEVEGENEEVDIEALLGNEEISKDLVANLLTQLQIKQAISHLLKNFHFTEFCQHTQSSKSPEQILRFLFTKAEWTVKQVNLEKQKINKLIHAKIKALAMDKKQSSRSMATDSDLLDKYSLLLDVVEVLSAGKEQLTLSNILDCLMQYQDVEEQAKYDAADLIDEILQAQRTQINREELVNIIT